MVLTSVETLIGELEKDDSITLEKSDVLRKWLVVGYDIEGRNWSENIRLRSAQVGDETHRNITEAELAELRGYGRSERSNAKRNRFREKLKRMGALFLSQSLYLLPLKVIRDNEGKELDIEGAEEWLKAWGEDEEVKIHTFGFSLESQRSIEGVSKVFKKQLLDRYEEMEAHLKSAHDKLFELQNEIADNPKKNIRGIHRIVEAIDKQTIDAQELISRYSDDEDEEKLNQFRLTSIVALRDKIEATYANIVAMKERQKE